MTRFDKTTALLNDLDFTNHDPNNLLECFYVAAAEAQILARELDAIAALIPTFGMSESAEKCLRAIVEPKP